MLPDNFSLPQFSLRAFTTAILIGVPYLVFLRSGAAAVPQELFTAAWVAGGSALGVDAVKAFGVSVQRQQ